MSGTLRFEVLGPQRAWYGDRELDAGPGKQRAVLAVLLLSPGRPVPTGQIVEAVWPEDSPANGPNVVQKYVAGLRRVLEPDRSPRTPGQVLTLTDAGYLLRVPPASVDAVVFEREVHRAQRLRAEGRVTDAVLGPALESWRGEPFTGLPGPLFDSARHRLVELRAAALETRAEIELDLGRHREMVGELVELTAEFPLRGRLRHQLMLALHRSGRQAEALAVYREHADLLREEFGIEPDDALQRLHRRILRSDPTLMPAAGPAAVPTAPAAPESPSPAPVASSAAQAPSPAAPVAASPGPAGSPSPAAPGPALPAVPVDLPSGPQAAAAPDVPSVGGTSFPTYVPPPPVPSSFAVPTPAQNRARPGGTTPRWVSATATVAGTLLVLLSFGCLTWLVVLAYAAWRRSWRLALAGLGYLALVVVEISLLDIENPEAEPPMTTATLFIGLAAVSLFVGAAHVVVLNRGVWATLTGGRGSARSRAEEERRIRREHSRYLLYHYPAARAELRIGRPDLPRTFDDGGLIDVNAVPEQILAGLPGLTVEQCRHLAVDRWLRGPYVSIEEFAGRCMLPPQVTEPLRDLLVFLPPITVPSSDPARPPGS
ncbi:transcriptional regulator [Micromonospora sp. 15K316]|uniref:AfsR/SARP family transcriptional regulator n=1 Tax=Micromonospora sp. 15K316 TaxID=2530376 RepID=UPI00105117BB|nr:AfsR/SARP family transcriptional regulator [Micromonospora sp. 15K316]TDC39101.1 transcriptional regulator [Micromonospora sp. 15K316]